MFLSDLKNTFRTLKNDRLSAAINLTGMATALTASLLILFFIRKETSVDDFHPNSERLFRLTQAVTRSGKTVWHSTSAPPMAPAMEETFQAVEKTVRLRYTDESLLRRGSLVFYETGLWYADSAFFHLFNFPLASGNPHTALSQPNVAVITPEIARKYFDREDPLGKTLLLDNSIPLTITGVLKEAPRHTHLQFQILVSMATFRVPVGYPVDMNSWSWGGFHSYVLLKDGVSRNMLEEKFPGFLATHLEPESAKARQLSLMPIEDCYFHTAGMYGANRNRTGNLAYVKGLGLVGIIILLVAAFNFANLGLARSVRRAKEVGIRKVLGASEGGLIRLFLSESLLLSSMSLLLGLLVLWTVRQKIETWLGWDLQLRTTDLLFLLPAFFLISLLTGLAAGWLPAWYFTRKKAIQVLKGAVKTGGAGKNLRKLLVGAQFFAISALITGALAVQKQMEFMQSRDLGFDREQIVALQLSDPNFLEFYPRLRERLLQNPKVAGVSAGEMFSGTNGSQPIRQPHQSDREVIQMDILGAYYDYFKTIGVEVLEGREFGADTPRDTATGVILNETAVRILGWPDPVGRKIRVGDIKTEAEVVGVVRDFHYRSLHEPIKPLVIFVPETVMRYVIVRLHPGDLSQTIAGLQSDWAATLPQLPFDLKFLDENLQSRYAADRSFSRLIYLFTGLTFVIAALGLYGLVAILLGFRVREIAIRKVLGARVAGITAALMFDFLKWVAPAIVLSALPAWYLMDKWLTDFAYRIELQGWMFVMAGMIAVMVAMLTIGFQSVKVALENPVKSLRSE